MLFHEHELSYAEIGKFERAVELSNQAVELAEEEIGEQLAAELASYQSKKPWRERKTIEPEDDLADDLGE